MPYACISTANHVYTYYMGVCVSFLGDPKIVDTYILCTHKLMVCSRESYKCNMHVRVYSIYIYVYMCIIIYIYIFICYYYI